MPLVNVRISRAAARILHMMVWNPPGLNPLKPQGPGGVAPFQALNDGAKRELFKLSKFLDLKLVAERREDGAVKEWKEVWRGRIRKEIVELIQEMMVFYKESLSLSFNVNAVVDLDSGLKGEDAAKEAEADFEDADPAPAKAAAPPA